MSVDDYVAAIFGALEAAGVLDNTYVIATSDHGCEEGGGGRGDSGQMCLTHLPLPRRL